MLYETAIGTPFINI